MKETRASFALLFFIIAVHIAHLLPQTNSVSEISQSYPATVCPSAVSDARATDLFPNKSSLIRAIDRPQADLKRNGQGSYLQNSGAIYQEGNPVNTIQIQSKLNRWTAALTCDVGSTVAWFVGGTANVTSQNKLILVNSGLGDAIVDVTSFSENGPTATVPVTVKPSSEKVIRVDSFDPGSNRLVLRVETRSGRVTTYFLDERVRGLNNIGGDFIAPIENAAKEIVIAGLPVKYGSTAKAIHKLRIMTPGNLDADVNVEVISPEGVFIPVGFSDISLKSQQVRELDLSEVDLGSKTFALKIEATQPVVAAVLTEAKTGSVSDFMWSTASQPFGNVSYNLYGLEPMISLVGERILVNVAWRNNRGRELEKTLIGEEVLNWKVPSGARLISITNQSGVKGAMNWISRDGITRLPLQQGANLESSKRPVADIAVIQPKK